MVETINPAEQNVLHHLRTIGLPQNSLDFFVCIISSTYKYHNAIVFVSTNTTILLPSLSLPKSREKNETSIQKHIREKSRLLFEALVLNFHGSILKMLHNLSLVLSFNIHINGDKCHLFPYVLLSIK